MQQSQSIKLTFCRHRISIHHLSLSTWRIALSLFSSVLQRYGTIVVLESFAVLDGCLIFDSSPQPSGVLPYHTRLEFQTKTRHANIKKREH
ncbi:uncharacterized protein UV8b_01513 [Ustilaginoidea virens]|uniref:Uncharacterized protein n=1 Tax=Ustilaginoidea virens TaxID=1159556 RepID=A0A8E5MFB8_USTVR|nr:uncharacterized protein UV8b_01513 [Ustilaginoidea virens]QUC17272.1 hypothetical protein UV8b_01513 [Ustilaginoidea virens]